MNSPITKEELEVFVITVDDFFSLSQTEHIDYFVYFLTSYKGMSDAKASLIRECFQLLHLNPYSNIPQYLNQNLKGKGRKKPKYLKTKDGFNLHRERKIEIETTVLSRPLKVKAKSDLHSLISLVKNPIENEFLMEAISCFDISAYRASIIMVWNLTLDHLFEWVLAHKLVDFNSVLSKNTDKRIKITAVNKKDDFNEIPEGKFIEFCRSANIISNDVRKVLDMKLGIRNSYAHPSSLKMTENKAIEFIEDLVNNVIVKYNL